MRSLMFLLVLVLFCPVPIFMEGTSAFEAAHSKCCFEFIKVKVPVSLVESYFWTSRYCPKRAIVFQTFLGSEYCVDPQISWVNSHVAKVDKRTKV